MRTTTLSLILGLAIIISAQANPHTDSNFKKGNPNIASINAMSFGPGGILFIGDSENAKVYALDTKDTDAQTSEVKYNIANLDVQLAELMGTNTKNISISDLAVNPISKAVYLAVTHTSGSAALIRVGTDNKLSVVDLTDISYSDQDLENAVATDAKDRRGRKLRKWAISDMNYANGQVMLTGLSNQEFGSTFRAMPYPFDGGQEMASMEIYHAAHGQYETNSPVKAFTTTELKGKQYIVASYTCTPLVVFPTSDLKAGEHVRGRTVAELGNRNTPLDMIVMKQKDEAYLLLANTSRALMKIKLSNVEDFNGSLTEPVMENSATAGVDFIALPLVNVQQLAKLNDTEFVMLQRKADGNLSLSSYSRW